ncbi:hypothetical protein [Marinomonas algarum]|uniref:Uncharacterized protein n=1 Tax=Marinomonas algarum TaxID=2883105 RepID=A0A9X1LDJ4_9GAMM|nr:hypothetical protein [Marinomonas algarum]MCB5162612.1 hypothetical protein [Marinomonas algarum]
MLAKKIMKTSWDGKISNLKISNESSKELFNELESLNARERCERLRTLATLGLYSLNFLGQNNENKKGSNEDVELNGNLKEKPKTDNENVIEAQKSLKSKLLGSM